jgi:Kef-type K+ transport system membrane component KefB
MEKVSKAQLIGLIFLVVYVGWEFIFGNIYQELKEGQLGSIFMVACLVLVLIALTYKLLIEKSK